MAWVSQRMRSERDESRLGSAWSIQVASVPWTTPAERADRQASVPASVQRGGQFASTAFFRFTSIFGSDTLFVGDLRRDALLASFLLLLDVFLEFLEFLGVELARVLAGDVLGIVGDLDFNFFFSVFLEDGDLLGVGVDLGDHAKEARRRPRKQRPIPSQHRQRSRRGKTCGGSAWTLPPSATRVNQKPSREWPGFPGGKPTQRAHGVAARIASLSTPIMSTGSGKCRCYEIIQRIE